MTKAIPGFVTEKSSLKPVFSTLTMTAKRWRRVTFTKAELARPDRLKDEPGMIGLKEEVNGKGGLRKSWAICFYSKMVLDLDSKLDPLRIPTI